MPQYHLLFYEEKSYDLYINYLTLFDDLFEEQMWIFLFNIS